MLLRGMTSERDEVATDEEDKALIDSKAGTDDSTASLLSSYNQHDTQIRHSQLRQT